MVSSVSTTIQVDTEFTFEFLYGDDLQILEVKNPRIIRTPASKSLVWRNLTLSWNRLHQVDFPEKTAP